MIQYRPEIDGLRGFAVAIVVLFHAGLPYITGGYVGVDIFFVISGYLITSIIIADIHKQKFSFTSFYERRVRRILPAMYVMATLVFLFACWYQTPLSLIKTSKSILAALFFSSNIYFWRTTNYFSDDSDYEPFLHTWSLGVEEQFYFFFPIIILLFVRRANLLRSVTVLALISSIILSIVATYHYTWAGYYLLPSRAWQMMAGALLAIQPLPQTKNVKITGLLSIITIGCLIIPTLLYDNETRFPGVAAIAPTLGATLLIYLGTQANLNASLIFKWPPLVKLGLISYSLYLWHWPVFAFLRSYYADVDIPLTYSTFGILVSIGLAWLSWKYVEGPFRSKEKISRNKVFTLTAIYSLILAASFSTVIKLDGIPARLDPKIISLSSLNGYNILNDPCFSLTARDIQEGRACTVSSNKEATPSIAFWGDSHAGALKQEFAKLVNTLDKHSYVFGNVGCPPIPGILKTNYDNGRQCLEYNQATLDFILSNKNITTVIIHARWALSVEGTRYKTEGGRGYEVIDNQEHPEGSNATQIKTGMVRLTKTLQNANIRVIFIGPVPEIGFNVPRNLANNLFWHSTRDIRPSLSEFNERQHNTLQTLQTLQELGAEVIYPSKTLCNQDKCDVTRNGESLYFDDDHLSNDGAQIVLEQLKRIL